ncbi:hypothetical protein U1Q18_048562 [Sarracenia purpurea var. burkii]
MERNQPPELRQPNPERSLQSKQQKHKSERSQILESKENIPEEIDLTRSHNSVQHTNPQEQDKSIPKSWNEMEELGRSVLAGINSALVKKAHISEILIQQDIQSSMPIKESKRKGKEDLGINPTGPTISKPNPFDFPYLTNRKRAEYPSISPACFGNNPISKEIIPLGENNLGKFPEQPIFIRTEDDMYSGKSNFCPMQIEESKEKNTLSNFPWETVQNPSLIKRKSWA